MSGILLVDSSGPNIKNPNLGSLEKKTLRENWACERFLGGSSVQGKCEAHSVRWREASGRAISLAPAKGERLSA